MREIFVRIARFTLGISKDQIRCWNVLIRSCGTKEIDPRLLAESTNFTKHCYGYLYLALPRYSFIEYLGCCTRFRSTIHSPIRLSELISKIVDLGNSDFLQIDYCMTESIDDVGSQR